MIRHESVYTGPDPILETVDPFDQRRLDSRNAKWVHFSLTLIKKTKRVSSMRKASSRGFGFTAIAVLVILMALSALFTSAEAAVLLL